MTMERGIETAYALARERYAALGVDTEKALADLARVELSLHCWQGDDVTGFENTGEALGGGLAATGNYPGRARNADELRCDLDQAYNLIPGRHRLNLHAIYAETGGRRIERNELRPEHFSSWVDWAKARGHGLDFNPTCFSHPKAGSGFTLASRDEGVRRFWIEHCQACRRIGEFFGETLGSPCVTNIWIADGFKDTPVDRRTPRELLRRSLDEILAPRIDPRHNLDAVESKLFGIGSESYVVGSHEFYLGYALTRGILLCLDAGHFHPTEGIADKISALLIHLQGLLLHISRGIRWDSDHVVTLTDEVAAVAQEIVRGDCLDRVHIGLDYFDASINRVAAWVIGARSVLQALLQALLEPRVLLSNAEASADYTTRLAVLESLKSLPWGAVWDYHCLRQGVPVGAAYMEEIRAYERTEMAGRG